MDVRVGRVRFAGGGLEEEKRMGRRGGNEENRLLVRLRKDCESVAEVGTIIDTNRPAH